MNVSVVLPYKIDFTVMRSKLQQFETNWKHFFKDPAGSWIIYQADYIL